MSKTIKLRDGKHTLKPPTFYALQLASEYGVDFEQTDFKYSDISAMLAAFLTDSEPLTEDGTPVKVWTPTMAAKVIEPADVSMVLQTITDLLTQAFPESSGDSTERPTSA